MSSPSPEMLWAYHRAKLKGASQIELTQLRNQIAIANDKLAIAFAHRASANCDLPVEDLIQLSRLGFLKAIEKFDPSKGNALSSFAEPYCRGEIKHHLRDHKSLVKTPRRWVEKRDEVQATQDKLAAAGRIIQIDEVATVGHGLPGHKWRAIAHATANKPLMSLDDEEALQIADEPQQALEEQEEREAIRAALLQRLGKLEPQIKTCIVEHFWGGLAKEVIAKRRGVAVAVVESLIEKGIQELRGDVEAC